MGMGEGDWRVVRYEGVSSFKRVRVRREREIRVLLDNIRGHEYSVVLGAPFNEMTRFLQDLLGELQAVDGFRGIYINLRQVRSDDEGEFYSSLARVIARNLVRPQESVWLANGRDFQNFLVERMEEERTNLALLIDHHQVLPSDLLHSLLRALRSVYMERNPSAFWKLSVVMAGQVDLDMLSQGPTSPFNMAKRLLLPPLTREQSRALAQATFEDRGLRVTDHALERILDWAGGDCYLIPHLCQLCQEVVAGYRIPKVSATVVEQAARRLPAIDSALWPIREAIQIIEEDPPTLLDAVTLLGQGALARSRSRQHPSRSGVDRLQLSGLVTFDGAAYQIKNRFFRQQFEQHLTPARVGHVLRMNGRWQEAIGYLAPHLQDNPTGQARADLLEAIVQSIYAADNVETAYTVLAEGIAKGFGQRDVAIYQADVARSELRLITAQGREQACSARINLREQGRVEVQAFQDNGHALRRGDDTQRLVAPLTPERRPIGVVTVGGYDAPENGRGVPEDLHELLRFLRHAAGAIEHVMTQAAIQEIGRAVLDAETVQSNLRRVLQAVCNGLASDAVCLYLLDSAAARLDLAASVGTLNQSIPARLGTEEEHPVALCVQRAREGDAASGAVIRGRAGSALYIHLPLEASGNLLGVLSLYFAWTHHPRVNAEYRRLLSTFADQVAIAIYNNQLLHRTDTALQKRVEELEEVRRELEFLREQEMYDVAWAVSHRLSNTVAPLTDAIDSLLATGEILSPTTQDALLRAQRRLESLTSLIKPLKAITSLEGSYFERLDVCRVVATALERVPPCDHVLRAVEKPDGPVWIAGNRGLLCDAFQSLIENACEAMMGRGRLAVRIVPEYEHRRVRVRVIDTGPGIPGDMLERIFDPGFSTKDLPAGNNQGAGLFTCRAIVRKHRGDIRAFSEGGKGAMFVVTLPLLA